MLQIILFGGALAALLYFGFTWWRRTAPAQPSGQPGPLPEPRHPPTPAVHQAAAAQALPNAEAEQWGPHVPQEPVLRRHFLTHVRCLLDTVYPCPSESVLRRHHAQWLETQVAACLEDPARWARLETTWRGLAAV